jgi:Fic family protein
MSFIYELPEWPQFVWNREQLTSLLAAVRHRQGLLLGQMRALGFSLREEANLNTITLDVVKSSEIEGELLDRDQVRSSIARRLGIDIGGLVPTDRHVDGVVEMMLDATQNFRKSLSDERFFDWHAALFPTGRSGMTKIVVGTWRDGSHGPMQVVSGAYGRERVHFEAPKAEVVATEMAKFIDWFNQEEELDPVIKAGIAHLWFVTIHPFEDGNGRIARAIADLQLARADGTSQRFYSMSAQIRQERADYYKMLEATQRSGDLDITLWLRWFLDCLNRALETADTTLGHVLEKARFWEKHRTVLLNDRQHTMLAQLLENFQGKLTSSKWAQITKCSQDTALRDILDLIEKDILVREEGGGRSTSYRLRV